MLGVFGKVVLVLVGGLLGTVAALELSFPGTGPPKAVRHATVYLNPSTLKAHTPAQFVASRDDAFVVSPGTAGDLLQEVDLGVDGYFSSYLASTIVVSGLHLNGTDVNLSVVFSDGTTSCTVDVGPTSVKFTSGTSTSTATIDNKPYNSDGEYSFMVHFCVQHTTGLLLVRFVSTSGASTYWETVPASVMSRVGSLYRVQINRGSSETIFFGIHSVHTETVLDNQDAFGILHQGGTLGNYASQGAVGLDFFVNEETLVTQLGCLDRAFTKAPVQVAIFDTATGNVLAGPVTFSSDEPGSLVLGTRMIELNSPVLLSANIKCSVVAFGLVVNVEQMETVTWKNHTQEGLIDFGSTRYSKGDSQSLPSIVVESTALSNTVPLASFAYRVVCSKASHIEANIFLGDALTGTQDSLSGEYGFEFLTKSAFLVTSLGRMYTGSRLTANHVVNLWRVSDQALIASTTVGPGSEHHDTGYASQGLTQGALLDANQLYRLTLSAVPDTNDPWFDATASLNTSSLVEITQGVTSPTRGSYPDSTLRVLYSATLYAQSLILALDAQSLTNVNGTSLDVWRDLSGFRNHLSQPDATKRPVMNSVVLNANEADHVQRFVSFDGAACLSFRRVFSSDGSNATYVFAVRPHAGALSSATAQYLMHSDGSQPTLFLQSGKWYVFSDESACSIPATADEWQVITLALSGDRVVVSVNQQSCFSVQKTFTLPSSASSMGLFCSTTGTNAFDGDVGQVLLFSSLLWEHEMRSVESLLLTKWVGSDISVLRSSDVGSARKLQIIDRVVGSDELAALDAEQRIFFKVLKSHDWFGASVSGIGDLDADGVNDMLAGAPGDDEGGTDTGSVFAMFMTASGTVRSFARINAALGTPLERRLTAFDRFGTSVAWLGDLNGDGLQEIAVGAPGDNTDGDDAGAVWILSLRADGGVDTARKITSVELAATPAALALAAGDAFGSAVEAIGDIDGDGVMDLGVGADGDDDGLNTIDAGAVYILFLNADGTVRDASKLSNFAGQFGHVLPRGARFGAAIAGLGDLNLDGVPDIAVGAPGFTTQRKSTGAVHIVQLHRSGSVINVQCISETDGGFLHPLRHGDKFGGSIEMLGDVDGDGVQDIAVGAWGDDEGGNDRGAVYVLFLSRLPQVREFQKLGSSSGHISELGGALQQNEGFGRSLAALGDLSASGELDLAIGAQFHSTWDSFESGAIRVVRIKASEVSKGCYAFDEAAALAAVVQVTLVSSVAECNSAARAAAADMFAIARSSTNTSHICFPFRSTDTAVASLLYFGGNLTSTVRAAQTVQCNTTCEVDNRACGANGFVSVYRCVSPRVSTSVDLQGVSSLDALTDMQVTVSFDSTPPNAVSAFRADDVKVWYNGTLATAATSTSILGSKRLDETSFQVDWRLSSGDGDYAFVANQGAGSTTTAGSSYASLQPTLYSVDTEQPAVSISLSLVLVERLNIATLTISFSEPVEGFAVEDVAIVKTGPTNTLPVLTLASLTPTVALVEVDASSAGSSSSVDFTIPADAVQDVAGNPNTKSNTVRLLISSMDCVMLRYVFTITPCCQWERDGTEGGYLGDWATRFSGFVDNATFADLCTESDKANFEAVWTAKGCSSVAGTHCTPDVPEGVFLTSTISDTRGQFYENLPDDSQFGTSVASIGDVDGDGVVDLVVGAPGDLDGLGAVYVVFMNATGECKASEKLGGDNGNLSASLVNGTLVSGARVGASVGFGGDLNYDGVPDIAVGLGSYVGVLLIELSNKGIATRSRFVLATDVGLTPGSDGFGAAVASAGDVDHDGVLDLFVGAPFADGGSGAVVVVMLTADGGVKASQIIANGRGRLGTDALVAGANFGWALAALLDLDKDGVMDMVVGAPALNATVSTRGSLWVVLLDTDGTVKKSVQHEADGIGFGKALAFFWTANSASHQIFAPTSDGRAMQFIRITEDGSEISSVKKQIASRNPAIANNTNLGSAITILADMDADGFDEIVLGASGTNGRGWGQGAVHVINYPEAFQYMGCYNSSSANRVMYDPNENDAEAATSGTEVQTMLECYAIALRQGVDRMAATQTDGGKTICYVFSSTAASAPYFVGPGVDSANPIARVDANMCNNTCGYLACGDKSYYTSVYAISVGLATFSCQLMANTTTVSPASAITITLDASHGIASLTLDQVVASPSDGVVLSNLKRLSSKMFTFDASMTAAGDYTFTIPFGTLADGNGLPNLEATYMYTYDPQPPTPTLSMSVGSNGTCSNAKVVTVTVNFDKPVVRFATSKLNFSLGSGSDFVYPPVLQNATVVSGETCFVRDPETEERYWTYETCVTVAEVVVTFNTSWEQLVIFRVAAGVIWDIHGTPNLPSSFLYLVHDPVSPVIESIQVDSGNLDSETVSGPGHEITLTVTTFENLHDLKATSFAIGGAVRTPTLERLPSNYTTHFANVSTSRYLESHALNVWRLSYTVQAGDSGSLTYELTPTDIAGNVGAAVSNTNQVVNKQITVDTTAPVVTATSVTINGVENQSFGGPGDELVVRVTTAGGDLEGIFYVDLFGWEIGGVQRNATAAAVGTALPATTWDVQYTIAGDDSGYPDFELVLYDVAGNSATVNVNTLGVTAPLVNPRLAHELVFEDTNSASLLISGVLTFSGPTETTGITAYNVYLGQSETEKTGNLLGTISTNTNNTYSLNITNADITNATYLLVFTFTTFESPFPANIFLFGGLVGPRDFPTQAIFRDEEPDELVISGMLSWEPASDSNVAYYAIYLSESKTEPLINGVAPEPLTNASVGTNQVELFDIDVEAPYLLVFSSDQYGNHHMTPAVVTIDDTIGPRGVIPRITFWDSSESSAEVSGWLEWEPATPTDNVVHYNIYVGDSPTTKLGDMVATEIHSADATQYKRFIRVARETMSRYILVYVATLNVENPVPTFIKIPDHTTVAINPGGTMTVHGSRVVIGDVM